MSPQSHLQGQPPSRPTTVMRLLTSSRPRTTGNKRLDRHSSAPMYFVPDAAITPDNEDEATLLKLLQSLKNRDVMFDEKDKVAGTYSRLLKPALNSASGPVNFGQDEDWDPELTLGWSNRGLGDKKMGVLKDTIMGNPHLSGIKLAGNNLGDECVAEILAVLSSPDAPHIRQIDFSSNPKLTWKCSQALASALGLDSQAGMEKGINLPLEPTLVTSCPIEMLRLSRLLLGGVKLGDKGATLIAGALRNNRILKELDLSRCKISDIGGIALMSALEVGCLISLDISWNALRGESARALRQTLTTNGSLQKIDLGHNGLSDQDASVILMGLTHHGTWRNVDLSYNNLGAGSALVISELTDVLARRAGTFIRDGKYAEHWDLEQFPAGCIDSGSWLDPIMGSPRKPSTRLPSHEAFGAQLQQGPLLIDASGNPIGFAGLRQVLHSLDWMSTVLEEAVEDAKHAAGGAGLGSPHEDALPWPINVRISNCNVDITDVPPEGSEVEGMDPASPNPFLPSIMRLMEVSASDEGKRKSKKSGGEKGRAEAGKSIEYFLSAQSQSLDLTSPAGKYQINLAHPASWLVVRHLLDLSVEIQRAADKGVTGVSVNLKDVTLNEKPFRVDRLPSTADLELGLLKFNIQSPSVLLANNPSPITDMVVEWMLLTLGDLSCAQLWKLSVIAVACSHFYFTWDQALKLIELFDADMATSERLRAGEMLYARCVQPLDFWLEALPKLPFQQAELLMARMGELAAFDIDNPSGRFMLNLSRGIDRFVALRLQVTSVLEGSWRTCRYFVNWRNAMINGVKLSMEGLQKLREYTMPCSGTLRIDYVTYKVPELDTKSCTKADIKSLLTQLRTIYRSYDKEMHGLRLEYLPHARLQSAISAAATKSAQIKKRWSVAKTFCISIQNMATRLESLFQHENRQVGQEPAKQVRGMSNSTGSSTKSIDASKAPEGSPDPSQTQPPPKSWWQEAGFSQVGNALISKFKEVHRQREEKMASIAARHRAEAEAKFYSGTYTRTFSRLLSSMGSSRRCSAVLPDSLMSSPSIEQAGLPMLSEEGIPVDITVSLEASQLVNTVPPAPAPLTTLPTATPPSTAASAHSPPVIAAAFSSSPPLVTNPPRSTSPGKQGGAKGLLNSKGNPLKGLPPISPPQNRTEGATLSPEQELQAQELVVALLRVHSIADATKLLSKFSAKHTARTLYMMVRMDPVYGTRAAARLLDAMAPISAIRFLFQLFDQIQPLLPAEVRRKLMAACRSELIQRLKMLLTQVDGLSLKRCRQIRITLQCFASFHYVTSDQVLEILKRLRFEQDRCSALVTLWARIIDRPGIYNIFQVLSVVEQRQVLIRLGYWHVWTTLGRPQSLHFYLDLTDQEQKDVAKDVLKLGCKASIAAKAAAKAQGITQAARHLVNLRGNGSLMSIAEDEKMWMMIENSYSSLEFDYAPTADQLEKKKLAAVITIQKQWRTIQAMRRVVYTPLEGASRIGNESMETLAITSTSA
ncbi:hypothetical protein CEUSTIGMA_g11131.t1 [Chlamydomonas eustigma]|uniref:DUF4476 domain-containing protein n=1 Tax=Chlamydomonas eustigma TaxID=1157962 RepID=A0A250XL02_9CHLO|nr:hypothetical protein CEUSTIGMA_g11131.t1 [Chlamydomonas eustigma]|eukprot:GAX83706.1 hypothetical protein CEUSTIGMA_g11131.t1 [Chlamydomonas eustigma]